MADHYKLKNSETNYNGRDTVKSHIGWKGERSTLYKGVDTFPYQTRFENRELRRAVWSKWQSGQYLLAGFLGCYRWYQSRFPSRWSAGTLNP
ncbi:hypothetical protein PanWU01x14_042600 [Parasponia andersonii]|uniref:Uncharacterized protein n=1 Tax=Parasponia andersonii TaxID=3476 RepID=A0A2P5DPS4_PARAD|nr:hypothetical protein PanWU01x14_042600 [Parasponia andersonii]